MAGRAERKGKGGCFFWVGNIGSLSLPSVLVQGKGDEQQSYWVSKAINEMS